jgi:cell division protein FtsN
MKIGFVFLILSVLMISCGGMRKSGKKTIPQQISTENAAAVKEPAKVAEPPIIEVKEKLVSVGNTPVDPNQYYVIIGSFRNLQNARRHQEQIAMDRFVSVLLRNEEGLYRVSVMSTDDITAARNEIRRIRNQFDKYDDTWLLIRLK